MGSLRDSVEDAFPDKYWVKAEIGQVNYHGTGHCYLELVQSENGAVVAKARAAIWRSVAIRILPSFEAKTGSVLKAGMQILLRVQVSCSEIYGISLVADQIDAQFTIGQQELERKKTIEKLTKEGLIDKQKSLSLVRLPYRLAVISAEGAAGYGDFIKHLSENPYGFALKADLFSSSMQGDACPEDVESAIELIQSSQIQYDAILILRGGGSAQDLVCFDSYIMASAIAKSTIPVITAIGHDRDFHIADMVAFDYVKTPTALADYFINIYKAEDDHLSLLERRINASLSGRIAQMQSRLDGAISRIRNVSLLKVERASSQISLLEARIISADPRAILKRGYTLATDASGVVLKNASRVSVGDNVSVRFQDGTLKCEVKEKIEK